MKRVILIDPIKDPRWDQFVMDHPFGWICHLSGWKQVLENSFKHMKGYYFALMDDAGEKIQAGLPVFHVKSRLTGNRLVSIPFATLCDPLISKSEDLDTLFQAVLNLSKKTKSCFIEIRTLLSTSLVQQDNGLRRVNFFKHHHLPLDNEIENIKKSFHRNIRYDINKALKSGLTLRQGNDISDLSKFYELHCLTRKRLGLPAQPFLFFKSLFEFLRSSNRGKLFLAETNGQLAAAGICLTFKNRFIDEYKAWDRKYNSLRPNYFLYWKTIEMAHTQGYEIFDFGRTSPGNKGLMFFKDRWGTITTNLPQFYCPGRAFDNIANREASLKYKLINSTCKKIPNFAYRYLGNFIYNHMG